MKKALKIGLSPCEERLCYEHFVDVDHILPLELDWGIGVAGKGEKGAKS